MIENLRRTVQMRRLETRKRKLENRRDLMMAELENGDDSSLYRHEYPNTPVLEDVILELDYVDEALLYHAYDASYPGYGAAVF